MITLSVVAVHDALEIILEIRLQARMSVESFDSPLTTFPFSLHTIGNKKVTH